MNCKLLIIVTCMLLSLPAFAQKKKNSPAAVSLKIPGTAFLYPSDDAMDQVKFDYKQINAPIPGFKAINYQGKDISDDLFNGSNLFVMIFNPTCDHCEDQALAFRDNIFLFKNSKILLIAADMMTSYLEYFDNGLHLSQYPTFTVSIDSAKVLNKLFNHNGLPQINIYSGKDKRLLKTFNEKAPLDSLKQYIE